MAKISIDLILFGTPQGFQTTECDDKMFDYLSGFYAPHKPGTEMKVARMANNDVYYVFLVHENPGSSFSSASGRPGAFFGMCFALNNFYVSDTNKMFKLFQATYDNYVKNKIIRETPNGSKQYMVQNLDKNIGENVFNGFMTIMETNPDLTLRDCIKPLSALTTQNQETRQ